MTEISATNAARNFAELLDAVEHHGERITIVRRGKPIAHLEPVVSGHGSGVKDLLKRHSPDRNWATSLGETRALSVSKDRF